MYVCIYVWDVHHFETDLREKRLPSPQNNAYKRDLVIPRKKPSDTGLR